MGRIGVEFETLTTREAARLIGALLNRALWVQVRELNRYLLVHIFVFRKCTAQVFGEFSRVDLFQNYVIEWVKIFLKVIEFNRVRF